MSVLTTLLFFVMYSELFDYTAKATVNDTVSYLDLKLETNLNFNIFDELKNFEKNLCTKNIIFLSERNYKLYIQNEPILLKEWKKEYFEFFTIEHTNCSLCKNKNTV